MGPFSRKCGFHDETRCVHENDIGSVCWLGGRGGLQTICIDEVTRARTWVQNDLAVRMPRIRDLDLFLNTRLKKSG
jgi:hypothetical protein